MAAMEVTLIARGMNPLSSARRRFNLLLIFSATQHKTSGEYLVYAGHAKGIVLSPGGDDEAVVVDVMFRALENLATSQAFRLEAHACFVCQVKRTVGGIKKGERKHEGGGHDSTKRRAGLQLDVETGQTKRNLDESGQRTAQVERIRLLDARDATKGS